MAQYEMIIRNILIHPIVVVLNTMNNDLLYRNLIFYL